MAEQRIVGLKELMHKLEDLEAKVAKKMMRQACKEGAVAFRDAAIQLCPSDTGKLKSSIKIKARNTRMSAGAKVVAGPNKTDLEQNYVGFVEFGTKDSPGDSFMRQAFYQEWENAASIIADSLGDQLKSLKK